MNKFKSRTLWFNVLWFVASVFLCYNGNMKGWEAALSMAGACGFFTASSLAKFWMQVKSGVQAV